MTQDPIASRARALADALVESGFARLRIREGETEIELRRSARPAPAPAPVVTDAPPETRPLDVIASDIVGVVRLARPAVTPGTQLDGDRELGSIEALGIRNAVRSRGPGRIADVLVGDGQPVEYGQPLFTIER